ncbi:AraC family transcriptional regulator [Nocardia sp. NPDC058499]|uniref:AraC family transcriptional regulator n=1 Tax=Nocardia sp. NPDC058499 TaxID=3346530 RepID=UPI003649AB83
MAARNVLEGHRVFATNDPGEACRRNSELLRAHTLRPLSDTADFAAVHHCIRLPAISVHYLEFGAAVEINADPDPAAEVYLVSVPVRGSGLIAVAGHGNAAVSISTGRNRGAVINPRAGFRSVWPVGCAKLIVRLEATALHRHLELLLQRPLDEELVFSPRMEPAATALWWRIVRAWTDSTIDTGVSLSRPPLSSALEQFLMTALLVTHQHNHRIRLLDREYAAYPAYLRTAIDAIRVDPSAPAGVAEVAAAAGVSIRTLQDGFATHLHTTPTLYLRRARLWRARADLLAAGPGRRGVVTDAATRWGFTNLGRFAQFYREEFGEQPSRTVREAPNISLDAFGTPEM